MNIALALEHHIAGRLGDAEALYAEILDVEPQHSDALYLLGVLAQQRGNHASASDLTSKAIAANPTNPVYHTTMGDLCAIRGAHDDAIDHYRQARRLAPHDADIAVKLAAMLHRQRRHADSALCYREALALRPDSADLHNDLGAVLLALGDFHGAAAGFEAALALRPDFHQACNNLGVAHKNGGNLDAAADCYRRALALQPRYAMAMSNLGTTHFARKDYQQAIAWYDAALAIEPGQVEAHQNLALIHLELGHLDLAQRHRDLAHGQQAVFIDTAPHPEKTVLVLWAAGKGNVPIDYLLPRQTVTRIVWMMEYATDAQRAALPAYDVVFNAIGDADVTGATAAAVEHFLADCAKPVFNRPGAVERTARDRLPAVLAALPGVVMPATVRLDTHAVKEQLAGAVFPLIVRPAGSHGGDHAVKLAAAQDLDGFTPFNAPSYYATHYSDYQSADGYYRKYRIVYVDGKPYPYHMAIGPHWMVHYETAQMPDHAWKLAEEQRFLDDPAQALGPVAMAAIEAIGAALGLDYCGVDFSLLPDGRVVVFEANATMLVHPEPDGSALAHKNPTVRRIFDAFDRMLARA